MGKNKWKGEAVEAEVEAEVKDSGMDTPAELPAVPAAKEPEAAPLPYVSLDVYLRIHALKPDQLAGFKRWAKATGKVMLMVPEWEKAYIDFMTRPVR